MELVDTVDIADIVDAVDEEIGGKEAVFLGFGHRIRRQTGKCDIPRTSRGTGWVT